LRRSGNTHPQVTDAIAHIKESAIELLDKKTDAQRAMIEAGESVFGQTQDGTGDYVLHVAAREMQAESVAVFFDHSFFDDLVARTNTAGELPRDVVCARNPVLAHTREARALRSILSVSRRTRAACILWCFEMLGTSAPERLVAHIPRDIVCCEIVKHILPPETPGSLSCGVATLLCSPVAWQRPCLAIVSQPTNPAEVLAMQQQQQQQQQQIDSGVLLPHEQQPRQAQIAQDADDSERGLKRSLDDTGPDIIDEEGGEEKHLEAEGAEPANKRARS
jgi:hypothetical protein